MWVQEGSDCKDSDDTISNSSLFSRFYSISKSKQTVSTIGIPMKSRPNDPSKNIINSSSSNNDEKETEKEKEESVSPTLKSAVVSNPISPAQFLENMNISINDSDDNVINNDDNNNETVDDNHDIPIFMDDTFNMNVDLKDMMEPQYQETDISDLTIIGKKLELYSIDNSDDDDEEEEEEETKEMEIDTNIDFDDTSKEEEKEEEFDGGLDIKGWIEWNECLNFSKINNGLLIIELYSSMFGASDVMYPFIHQILDKKQNDKIKFVRLSIDKMKQIDDIKQVIINYRCYESSPFSTYIFIKNGIKIDEIQGIKLREFEELINKYSTSHQQQIRPKSATNYGYPPTIKYKSILTQRPKSSYLPSSSNNNKENQNVENIINLINNLDTKYASH